MVNLGRHSNSRAGNKGTPFYVAPVSTLYSQADIRRLGYALESSLQNDAGKPVDLFFCLVHPEAQDFKTGITSAAFPTLAGGGNNSVCVFAIDKDQELHKCDGNTCLKGAPKFINVPGYSYDREKWRVVSQIPFKWTKSNSRWYQNQPWSPLLEGTSSEKNLYHISRKTPDFKYLDSFEGFEAPGGPEAPNTLIPPVQWKQFYGPENFMNDPRSLVLNGGAGEGRGAMPSWMPLPVAGGNERGQGDWPCYKVLAMIGEWDFSMFRMKVFEDSGTELNPNYDEEADCIGVRLRYVIHYLCVCGGGATWWGFMTNYGSPGVWNTWVPDGPLFPPGEGGNSSAAAGPGFAFFAVDFSDTGETCTCEAPPNSWWDWKCTCHTEHAAGWGKDPDWVVGSFFNPIRHGEVYIEGNYQPGAGDLTLDLRNHGKHSILWNKLVGGPNGCWSNSKLEEGVIGDYDTWKCVLEKIQAEGGETQLKKEFMTALSTEVVFNEPYKFFEHFGAAHPKAGGGCGDVEPDSWLTGLGGNTVAPPSELPGPQPPPPGTSLVGLPEPGGGGVGPGLDTWKCIEAPPIPCPRKEEPIGPFGSGQTSMLKRFCVRMSDVQEWEKLGYSVISPGFPGSPTKADCESNCPDLLCERDDGE
jgi:hypothetical protein